MKEYKVELIVSKKDKRFGEFNPRALENSLNDFARKGWRVVSCSARDIPGFGTSSQEFITVLEKDI